MLHGIYMYPVYAKYMQYNNPNTTFYNTTLL